MATDARAQTTFLMEESLTKLQTIYEIQVKKRDEAAWAAMPEADRVAEEKKLSDAEGGAQSYLQLANETIRLFRIFTGEAAAPFVRAEIVDRLAAMLDHNLGLLAGPRCQELRVSDPARFHFYPRDLLRDFIQIYLNLASFDDFAAAVARDGRSYDKSLFVRAERIGRKASLKTADELDRFLAFVDQVEAVRLEDAADDEAGEVPDEFLDSLTYTLMKDPVILPRAKDAPVDRSTIAQHLLSDPRCPFTSTPLTIEEVMPSACRPRWAHDLAEKASDEELKKRIDDFVAQRRAARQKPAPTTADDNAMAVDA